MLDKKTSQEQYQSINVANAEHGMTDSIRCRFVAEDTGSIPMGPAFLRMANEVKVLIYKGEVKKVFCSYFENGNCKSPYNNEQEKKCYLYK
ncbi:MAG: hypothetical protein V1833_05415 [Elusimicrobiota bacterium]